MPQMSRITFIALTVLAVVVSFQGVAAAAAVADPSAQAVPDLLAMLYAAVTGGQWYYAASISLVALVALARKYGGDRFPFFHTDQGAALLVLLGSFGGMMVSNLADHAAPTWGMVSTAFGIAFGAAGGYAMVKTLIVLPYLVPLRGHLPAPLSWLLEGVLYFFDHSPAAPVAPAHVDPPAA